jgi:ATP-dependent Lon protease
MFVESSIAHEGEPMTRELGAEEHDTIPALELEDDAEQQSLVDTESSAHELDAPAFRPAPRGGFFTTGQLGSVMRESSALAYTLSKAFVARLSPSRLSWFQSALVHVHVPSGAQAKDGPSAGLPLLLSLLSLALQRPLRGDVACTGELTLTGRVTRVGGLREKLLAARRAHLSALVLPSQCRAQIDEVSRDAPELVDGIELHFVEHVSEVLPIVFPALDLEPLRTEREGTAADGRQCGATPELGTITQPHANI